MHCKSESSVDRRDLIMYRSDVALSDARSRDGIYVARIRSIIIPTWRTAMLAFLNEALRFYAMTCGRQPAMPKRRASFSEMRALQLATSTIQSLQSDRRSSRQCFSQAITSGWRRGFRHANAVALSSSSFADREIRNSSVSLVGIRALLLLLLLID